MEKDQADERVAPSQTQESNNVGESVSIGVEKETRDNVVLQAMGYEAHLPRTIGFGSILAAGWNACNSWVGLAASLVTAITQGGTVTVLYGEIAMLFIIGCTALSVAELASSFPTAGGQYHYTSILAPKRLSRGLSYATGCINALAWIVSTASVTLTIPQQVLAIVANFRPSYVFQRWHLFIGYELVNVIVLLFNMYGLQRIMAAVHRTGFLLSISLFFVSTITCLVIASPKQDSKFVWATFTNDSGWSSDGIVFLTGLINPNYMYVGIDCAIHLAEDCANAAVAVPRAVLAVIVIGFLTAFPFSIAMFYCLSDFDSVLETVTGVPVYELWLQATRSQAGGTVLMVCLIMIQWFATNACQQTAGRLTWALGRDNALVFSRHIGTISPQWNVPIWALIFNAVAVALIGILYVASTTAYNAIIGTCLVLVQMSYVIPVSILMFGKRKGLIHHRSVRLGAIGWVVNAITVAWGIENLIIYDFPFEMPVTGLSMNYTCVVLAIMAILATINWFIHAKKYFHGPRIDLAVAEEAVHRGSIHPLEG